MITYKLDVVNGRVKYMYRAGKDRCLAETSEETAQWMIHNKPLKAEQFDAEAPEFCIRAGEYYFKGEAENDAQKKRRKAVKTDG